MPLGLEQAMIEQELVDLIEDLETLKKQVKQNLLYSVHKKEV